MPHIDSIFQLIEYISPVSSALLEPHTSAGKCFTGTEECFAIRANIIRGNYLINQVFLVWEEEVSNEVRPIAATLALNVSFWIFLPEQCFIS